MIETFLIAKLGERWGGLVMKLLPYIGLALAVLSAWLLAVGHGKSVQKAKDQARIVAEKARGDGYLANQIKLTDALNHQNATVAALRVEGEQRKADGKRALSDALRANQGLADQAAALRRSAGRKVDSTPCPVSETLKQAGAV